MRAGPINNTGINKAAYILLARFRNRCVDDCECYDYTVYKQPIKTKKPCKILLYITFIVKVWGIAIDLKV